MQTGGIDRRVEDVALSDEAVVALVREGDIPLYEVLVRRHNQKVYRAVRAVLRDDDEVEDVMQQAYVSAYQALSQFRGEARFSTWLVRIAVHAARARQRGKGRLIELVEDGAQEGADDLATWRGGDPEMNTGSRELGVVLEELIADLPERLRTVFVLREVEGMNTAEVAQALELSEDNVKTRLHRAKSALRDRITERIGAAAVNVWLFENPRCDVVAAGVMGEIKRAS